MGKRCARPSKEWIAKAGPVNRFRCSIGTRNAEKRLLKSGLLPQGRGPVDDHVDWLGIGRVLLNGDEEAAILRNIEAVVDTRADAGVEKRLGPAGFQCGAGADGNRHHLPVRSDKENFLAVVAPPGPLAAFR